MFNGKLEIYEKSQFLFLLNREKERALRYRRNLSLVVFSIIQQDGINPNGHKPPEGNSTEPLIEVLKHQIRCTDMIGKLDEHRVSAILLEANQRDAKRIAKRIQQVIENQTVTELSDRCKTIFLGGVCYPKSEIDPSDFLNMSISGGADFLLRINVQ